jgi:hypothetical protein
MDLEHKVFQQIEKEDIQMHSPWFFYAKDISKFTIALILMVISAIFCGISIALILHWASEISLVNFPYTLVGLSALTGFLAYISFVHSFSFYKIRLSFGVVVLLVATFSFGYALFTEGHAERLERKLQGYSAYHNIAPHSFREHERFEGRN